MSTVVIDGIKHEIRNRPELWDQCYRQNHNTCGARAQFQAIDPKDKTPVLVVQICNCWCHNRARGQGATEDK